MIKLKNFHKSRIFAIIFGIILIFGLFTFNTKADNGPPTPEEAFGPGHTFEEGYWDTNVFNNSQWDHPEVNNMTSWLNNTWNIKWIKEGNFEMGMLAFINKTHFEMGEQSTYTTPAQFWWQHAYLNGSEILIASMHCAWFGFDDTIVPDDNYTDGESINPFFYMGVANKEMREEVGIYSNPQTEATNLERSVFGSVITYSWSYTYNDIIFYVPHTDEIGGKRVFDWGFDYDDPGTYVNGSSVIGNQTYVSYTYTLDIDTAAGEATLHQDYEIGEFGVLMSRSSNISSWEEVHDGDPGYMPDTWAMALGTWSFIMADQDWAMIDHEVGEINATVHKTGLTTVETTLGGSHAFDFGFSQKPTYELTDINGTTPNTYPVLYECLDVNHDSEFIEFVSGMLPLMGDFARLVISYAVNQTNQFTYGIPFDDAWEAFHPNETAAFFITCYPKYGESGGGTLVHDPIFTAYFDTVEEKPGIPGYYFESLTVALMVGIIVVIISRKKLKKVT